MILLLVVQAAGCNTPNGSPFAPSPPPAPLSGPRILLAGQSNAIGLRDCWMTDAIAVLSISTVGLGQHVNIGYTFSGSVGRGDSRLGDLPDEVNYAAGAEYVAHPKLTLIGDLVGRSLPDATRLRVQSKTFQFVQTTGGPVMSRQFDEFEPGNGALNLLFGTLGAKFNPLGNLLISGSVLFPLTDGGLRNRVTTTIGIDYAF